MTKYTHLSKLIEEDVDRLINAGRKLEKLRSFRNNEQSTKTDQSITTGNSIQSIVNNPRVDVQ